MINERNIRILSEIKKLKISKEKLKKYIRKLQGTVKKKLLFKKRKKSTKRVCWELSKLK